MNRDLGPRDGEWKKESEKWEKGRKVFGRHYDFSSSSSSSAERGYECVHAGVNFPKKCVGDQAFGNSNAQAS